MKAWNLKAETIKVGGNERSAIALGDTGRGRKQTLIRCVEGIEDGEQVALIKPKVGSPAIAKGGGGAGWLMRISTKGAYIRGAYGNVKVSKDGTAVVHALGYGAFGDAGRIGTWNDYLLEVQPGTVLRVKPSRGDAHYLLVEEDSITRLTSSEAEFEGVVTGNDNYFEIPEAEV